MNLPQWRGFKLNRAVPENPFLILMVKSQSPGSHVFTRRGNFPSTHSKQSTSSQPWGGSLVSNYKGLCAGKPSPVHETSTISETFRDSLKNSRETSYGTSSWWSAQTDQLEMRFAGRTGMEVQGHFTPNCKYLSCGTGDPSQKAKDISAQEEMSPKICPHQHKWFNSMQREQFQQQQWDHLPISGKIWLRYSPQQLLQAVEHSVIAGYEGKSLNLQKQILVLFRVRCYSSDKEHAWKA